MESAHHINYLELLAVFLELKTFAKDLSHCTVLVKSNNISAVTYINQKGGAHSKQLCSLAIEIWEWCLTRRITLVAEHLPGIANTIADQESRTTQDYCDWMLNPSFFRSSKSNWVHWRWIFCIPPDKTPTMVLQLATGSRCGSDRCFYSELGSEQKFCKPSLVLDQPLLMSSGSSTGKDSVVNSMVEHSVMILSCSRNAGGSLPPSS